MAQAWLNLPDYRDQGADLRYLKRILSRATDLCFPRASTRGSEIHRQASISQHRCMAIRGKEAEKMNRQNVEKLLAGHGEGRFLVNHRIHGRDFEVTVSLLQASGNSFVRDYCASAPILDGTDGLGNAVTATFKSSYAAIER